MPTNTNTVNVTVVPVHIASPNLCSSKPAGWSYYGVELSFSYDSNSYTIYMDQTQVRSCVDVSPFGMMPSGGMFVDLAQLSNFSATGFNVTSGSFTQYAMKYITPYYYFQSTYYANSAGACNGANVSVANARLFKTAIPCNTTALPLTPTYT